MLFIRELHGAEPPDKPRKLSVRSLSGDLRERWFCTQVAFPNHYSARSGQNFYFEFEAG